MKRFFALALALCLLCVVMALPASAAGTDSGMIQTIQALGIMVGDESGDMALDRNVTRAEFAKMLTAASGYKDTISGQGSGYSLFKDVKSDFWASEYIKTALDAGWMIGYTDGTFRPGNTIALEEACTAALRLLNYDTSALAGSFPAAQLNKAAALGLRDGLDAARGDPMTRRDCMRLFYNLMTAQTSNGQTYAATLGYALNAAGELDYSALVAKSLKGPYTAAGADLALPFTPRSVYKDGSNAATAAAYDIYYYNADLKSVYLYDDRVTGVYTAAAPGAASPTSVTVGGKSYSIETADAAYALSAAGEFAIGDVVTLLLGMDGKVADVVSGSVLTADDMDYTEIVSYGLKGPYTAGAGGSMDLPFAAAEAAYYLNGSAAGADSVKQYDIYYYNAALKVVYVYNDRVTGAYTAAAPSTAAPASVTVAGNNYSLGSSEAKYKLSTLGGSTTGDVVTLLLGMDGTVADVLTGAEVESEYYGVIQSAQKTADALNAASVVSRLTVACTDGETYTFQVPYSANYDAGQLVSVTISGGKITAKRLGEKSLSGTVNSGGAKLGSYDLARDVQIIDAAQEGGCIAVSPSRLAGCTLDDAHVRYYALDDDGAVSRLILNDATGDLWSYGYLLSSAVNTQGGGLSMSASYTALLNGKTSTLSFNNKSYPVTTGGFAVRYGADGGVETMRSISSVRLSSLGALTAKADSKAYTIAGDVQVYWKEDGDYYPIDLESVNTEDYTLTGWYDSFGCPAGGRIRLITAVKK